MGFDPPASDLLCVAAKLRPIETTLAVQQGSDVLAQCLWVRAQGENHQRATRRPVPPQLPQPNQRTIPILTPLFPVGKSSESSGVQGAKLSVVPLPHSDRTKVGILK